MDLFELPFEVGADVLERARAVRAVMFDVDGVLTDGRLYRDDGGQEYKAFHSRDGHGIKLLARAGIVCAIITGRTSRVVQHRAAELGIDHVYQGCEDKLPVFHELLRTLGLEARQAAFVGDDVVDLPAMLQAGLAVTVADGHALARQYAHWTTPSRGGLGAARELCDLLLYAQGRYGDSVRACLMRDA